VKAKDIINFINEDKFSKYTVRQIFEELGSEDFADYLEKLCYSAVKLEKVKILDGMELTDRLVSKSSVDLRFSKKIIVKDTYYTEKFVIRYFYLGEVFKLRGNVLDNYGASYGYSDWWVVPVKATNILTEIRNGIKYGYVKSKSLNKYRQELLDVIL
jgi:hypothetical protein